MSFSLLMKKKFDAYLLWPFEKKFIFASLLTVILWEKVCFCNRNLVYWYRLYGIFSFFYRGKFQCIFMKPKRMLLQKIICCNYSWPKGHLVICELKFISCLACSTYIVYYTSDDVRTWSQRNFNHFIPPATFIAQYLDYFYNLQLWWSQLQMSSPNVCFWSCFWLILHIEIQIAGAR